MRYSVEDNHEKITHTPSKPQSNIVDAMKQKNGLGQHAHKSHFLILRVKVNAAEEGNKRRKKR